MNYFDSEIKPVAFPVLGSDRHRVESYDRIDAESLKGISSARRVKPHAPISFGRLEKRVRPASAVHDHWRREVRGDLSDIDSKCQLVELALNR